MPEIKRPNPVYRTGAQIISAVESGLALLEELGTEGKLTNDVAKVQVEYLRGMCAEYLSRLQNRNG